MAFDKVGFIGLGLIGGLIAMNFRRHYPYTKIIAAAGSEETIEKAYDMGVIKNESNIPLGDFADCDYIFLCALTSFNIGCLRELKDIIFSKTIIASTLAFQNINLKNMGIINNREFEEGVMGVEFYDRDSLERACAELKERNYKIYLR